MRGKNAKAIRQMAKAVLHGRTERVVDLDFRTVRYRRHTRDGYRILDRDTVRGAARHIKRHFPSWLRLRPGELPK